MLEAAGYDPLRAQEIEQQVSQLWWDRWRVDRAARIAARPATTPPRSPGSRHQITAPVQHADGRTAYRLTPDGRLITA